MRRLALTHSNGTSAIDPTLNNACIRKAIQMVQKKQNESNLILQRADCIISIHKQRGGVVQLESDIELAISQTMELIKVLLYRLIQLEKQTRTNGEQ